jgi:tetratricopeptide (TPR) repeat protein
MLLFSRATDYGFTNYDDPHYITENSQVQNGLSWKGVKWAFTVPNDYWHPLSWLSHMLDWELYGGNAGGHHLTSVIWHAINAVLAFLALRRLTGAYWTSAFAAALFAWHPLRVESVAWVTERKDVMSGCFFLLTLWAYAAYVECRKRNVPAWHFYLLTLTLFAAGLMSKPMLVTLPVLLLVLDFWPLGRAEFESENTAKKKNAPPFPWREWLRLVGEKIPFFALSVVTAVVTVLMQRQIGAFTLILPLDARLANSVVSIARYLGKFFWPFDLAVCYPHPGYWPAWVFIGSAILTTVLSAAAWRQRNTRPWLLTGWLWVLVVLLPAIGIVQVGFQSMADRYTYLSLIGWEVALLWSLHGITIRPALRWVPWVAGGFVLMGSAVRTWTQQAAWRDSITLFQHAIDATQTNDVAEGFLSYTLLGLDRVAEAEAHAERAFKINPRNDPALFTLASIRERQGRTAEAIAFCRAILEEKPADGQSEYQLGTLLLQQGHPDEAFRYMKSGGQHRPDLIAANFRIATTELWSGNPKNAVVYFEVATALDPKNAEAYFGAGLAFAKTGRTDEALASYRTVIQLRPDFPGAHLETGLILLGRHQPAEAAIHFRAVLASRPDFGGAHLGLGRALDQLGQTAEAFSSFERAMTFEPNNPAVLRAWAEALARRGRFAEALSSYDRAVQLQPNDAETHAGLGYMLFLVHRREEAIVQWEEALRLDPNFPGLRERLQKFR